MRISRLLAATLIRLRRHLGEDEPAAPPPSVRSRRDVARAG
jgi:hypothetical protein